MYSKKVLQYFQHPKNFGRMKNYSSKGKVGNIMCGDLMILYLKIEKDKIIDVKFETFGCAAAIATSSMITELAKGKTLKEALKIDQKKIVKSLGGLPPVKVHCSVLASEALAEAIYNYLSQNKRPLPKNLLERHKRIEQEKELVEKKFKQ